VEAATVELGELKQTAKAVVLEGLDPLSATTDDIWQTIASNVPSIKAFNEAFSATGNAAWGVTDAMLKALEPYEDLLRMVDEANQKRSMTDFADAFASITPVSDDVASAIRRAWERLRDLRNEFGRTKEMQEFFDTLPAGVEGLRELRRMAEELGLSIEEFLIKKMKELAEAAEEASRKIGQAFMFATGPGGRPVFNVPPIPKEQAEAIIAAAGSLPPGLRAAEFAHGGTVPGPVGQPRLAVVYGGETVLPTRGGPVGVNLTLNVYGDVVGVDDLDEHIRRTVREAWWRGGFDGIIAR
jgi:hypothetical protein